MTTKREHIEALLELHDNYIGIGNVKSSGRLVPRIVRALLDLIEDGETPAAAKPSRAEQEDSLIIERLKTAENRRVFYIDIGDMDPKEAEAKIQQLKDEMEGKTCQPCRPTDDLTKFGLSPEEFEEAKARNTAAQPVRHKGVRSVASFSEEELQENERLWAEETAAAQKAKEAAEAAPEEADDKPAKKKVTAKKADVAPAPKTAPEDSQD